MVAAKKISFRFKGNTDFRHFLAQGKKRKISILTHFGENIVTEKVIDCAVKIADERGWKYIVLLRGIKDDNYIIGMNISQYRLKWPYGFQGINLTKFIHWDLADFDIRYVESFDYYDFDDDFGDPLRDPSPEGFFDKL